jgi:anthranilate phosphoribosyltransferase
MIREAIEQVVNKQDLSQEHSAQVMEEIMTGEATPAQLGAFLTALRLKGETPDEIAGMARVMQAKANRVTFPGALLDTCGTGGDSSGSFNVSTAAAFVAAGAGATVAKHGNRAASSQCGSADVLEELGVKLELTPAQVEACLKEVGIGFMFAPAFHPAMRFAAPVRREIGIRTVFNVLGPLTNPAGASHQVLGVGTRALAPTMAQVLQRLGSKHALVVHSDDGLDEISISAPTQVWEVRDRSIKESTIRPEDFGVSRAQPGAIKGGTAADNAAMMRSLLAGEAGPVRDVVLINAAAALVASELAADIKQGIERAAEVIDSGAAAKKLDGLMAVSQRPA